MRNLGNYNGKNIYFLAGIFFLILQAIVVFMNLDAGRPGVLFWFCNHTPLFIGVAFLSRNIDIIKGFISVGFIAHGLWTFDFLGKLLFNKFIFGYSEYIFGADGLELLVPVLIHMFSITTAFLLTLREKTNKKVLLYALAYLVLLHGITIAYTIPEDNINCIQEICGFENITLPYYSLFWSPLVFIIMVLPVYLLQVLIYNKFYKKSRRR